MPVSLTELTKDERSITLDIGDETLAVTYRPGSYTPELEDVMRSQNERLRPGNGLAAALSQLVIEWDLEDDGKPVEVTLDTLRKLPVTFLTRVTNAITADMRTGKDERKNSGGGSQQAGSRGRSLSGTR